ncbi:hypothetical protein C0J52_12412 [Blattella germanica]|nr:hypothetical protein C0J52_12412 [Blattella germanica]
MKLTKMEQLSQEEELNKINITCDVNQEQDPMRYNERRRRRVIGPAMSLIGRLIFVTFTVYIIYMCFEDYSLFSWHPTCMTVGSLLLMAEAVMTISQDSIIASKLDHHGRVRLHWVLQAGAAGFIFAGFLVIVINKNINNKNHFQSWHSIIGLVFFILVGITSSGGVITLYTLRMKHFIKPAKMKLMHNLVGVLTFSLGVVTEIFGIYTAWFPKHSTPTLQLVCTVLVALAGIFTLEGALKSAYARFKALYQSL